MASELEQVARKIREKKRSQETQEYKGDKGALGQLIELIHFGLRRNSRSDYDLSAAKIELKSTGLELDLTSGKWLAKERLTLSQLNYQELVAYEGNFDEFESLDLLRNILIITFNYDKKPPFVFKNEAEVTVESLLSLEISDVIFWKPSDGQINDAFQDWKLIKAMCESGYAHLISERYCKIIGAGTRGQGSRKGEGAEDFSRQVVEEGQGIYSFEEKSLKLGVPVKKMIEISKDIPKRSKNPGKPKTGYALPKKGHDIAKHGKFPCQKRAYTIPENRFKEILKSLMEGNNES